MCVDSIWVVENLSGEKITLESAYRRKGFPEALDFEAFWQCVKMCLITSDCLHGFKTLGKDGIWNEK